MLEVNQYKATYYHVLIEITMGVYTHPDSPEGHTQSPAGECVKVTEQQLKVENQTGMEDKDR